MSAAPEFIPLVNALVTMRFACEPETYPVFIKWAEDHGYMTGPLARDTLGAAQYVLADLAEHAAKVTP